MNRSMPPAFPQAQRRSTDIVRYSLLPEPLLYRKKTTSENTSPVQALCIKLWHPAIALHNLSATSCGQYPQSGLGRLRHVDISVKCPLEYSDTFLYFLPSANSPDVHWHFFGCLRCTAAPASAPAPLPGASRPRSEPGRCTPFFLGESTAAQMFRKKRHNFDPDNQKSQHPAFLPPTSPQVGKPALAKGGHKVHGQRPVQE